MPKCTQIIISSSKTLSASIKKTVITTGIMKTTSTFKKNSKIKIVITDFLPRDKYYYFRQRKISGTNALLQKEFKENVNAFFQETKLGKEWFIYIEIGYK